MGWILFYAIGCIASAVWFVKTTLDQDRRYSYDGAPHAEIEIIDYVAFVFICAASWFGLLGTIAFRLSADYGFWGQQ